MWTRTATSSPPIPSLNSRARSRIRISRDPCRLLCCKPRWPDTTPLSTRGRTRTFSGAPPYTRFRRLPFMRPGRHRSFMIRSRVSGRTSRRRSSTFVARSYRVSIVPVSPKVDSLSMGWADALSSVVSPVGLRLRTAGLPSVTVTSNEHSRLGRPVAGGGEQLIHGQSGHEVRGRMSIGWAAGRGAG